MTTTLDRLRILIALAVLRNTPADQSYLSYILTLRDLFPSPKQGLNFWKERAQQLERECIELRAGLEKLQTRTFIETHASSAEAVIENNELTVPSSSDTSVLPKKKGKKKANSLPADAEAENLTEVLKFGRIGIRSGCLFAAMDTFLQLCSLADRPGFPRKGFFEATRVVCKAVTLSFEAATTGRITNLKALQVIQATICSVVDKAVPLVSSWIIEDVEALSVLLDDFLRLFINPIIPVFMIFSERNLAYMRNSDSGDIPAFVPGDYVDGRVSILALLQATFKHIESALSVSEDRNSGGEEWRTQPGASVMLGCANLLVMKYGLILIIVRHFREILGEGENTHKQKATRRRRIRRLAVKEAFWYLCSVVHFLLDRDVHTNALRGIKELTGQRERVELLRQTILDIMVELVLYQDRKRGLDGFCEDDGDKKYVVLDEMGYRMLLSLVGRLVSG